jgi:Fic family protein
MENSRRALGLKNQLDKLRPIDKEQEGRIMQKFRLDWNYHSNHLEGNSLTYGETKALILFGVTAQGKPLQDHFEITGHNEAINWVIDVVKGDYPLNENFIRELHTLLLKESYEVDAITPDGKPTKKLINVGRYKTSPNHVKTKTGEIFYFATPEETPSKMTDLINWYREKSEQKDVNPIFLAAEFHYKFIRIHPFDDGNGRTARILMNFILMKFDYPPVIIKTENKASYFAALQLADSGNIEAFIEYIAQNLIRSLEIMIAGAKGESIEEEDDLDKEIALLEQKLSGFGERIEKIKSEENINEVLLNSIVEIANQIKNKLTKFDNYYLNKGISIVIDGQTYSLEKFVYATRNCKEIRLVINYNTLKKTGLEKFRFYIEFVFSFEPLYYSVFEFNSENTLFKKNYEVLNKTEIKQIVDMILKKHNSQLDETLETNNL